MARQTDPNTPRGFKYWLSVGYIVMVNTHKQAKTALKVFSGGKCGNVQDPLERNGKPGRSAEKERKRERERGREKKEERKEERNTRRGKCCTFAVSLFIRLEEETLSRIAPEKETGNRGTIPKRERGAERDSEERERERNTKGQMPCIAISVSCTRGDLSTIVPERERGTRGPVERERERERERDTFAFFPWRKGKI